MQSWNQGRKERKLAGQFYCRRENCLVGGCPLAAGPDGCPLRPECPAAAAGKTQREP